MLKDEIKKNQSKNIFNVKYSIKEKKRIGFDREKITKDEIVKIIK
jgi:hypothetical protein